MQVLLLVQILHQTIAHLQYLLNHSWIHPLRAYEYLVESVAKLSSLAQKTEVQKIVFYDHNNLQSVFSALAFSFKTLIHVVVPERLAIIDLVKEKDCKYCSDNIPKYILEKQSFFLIVLHVEGETDWINRFLREVKISSIDYLDIIIASALPGLALNYVSRPPHQLPIKSGYQYFQICPLGLKGEHWEKIIKTRSMGIFLSGYFMNIEIKLLAIEE
jgi:type VI secretion system protein ImpJ